MDVFVCLCNALCNSYTWLTQVYTSLYKLCMPRARLRMSYVVFAHVIRVVHKVSVRLYLCIHIYTWVINAYTYLYSSYACFIHVHAGSMSVYAYPCVSIPVLLHTYFLCGLYTSYACLCVHIRDICMIYAGDVLLCMFVHAYT